MKLFPLRLIPDNTKIDFFRYKKLFYILAILTIILSLTLIFTKKFNYGIDFLGGINIEIESSNEFNLSSIRKILTSLNIGEVLLQNLGINNNLSIRIATKNSMEISHITEIIKEALNKNLKEHNITYRSVNSIGPQLGKEIVTNGVISLILAFLAIMIYIWFRFEWQFGIGIVITLIHDLILCLGIMSASQLDFNSSTIAALLTIIGYSVNDSVVIYDRIRDNIRKTPYNEITEITNKSINETLPRTTLTVITTLLANLALIIFGGNAIKSFSILTFTGIIIGTYSSICISALILTIFKLNKNN